MARSRTELGGALIAPLLFLIAAAGCSGAAIHRPAGSDAAKRTASTALAPNARPTACPSAPLEQGARAASPSARRIIARASADGKTADLVGFSTQAFQPNNNMLLWARFSAASSFRTFGSVQPKHAPASPQFGDGVTDAASFEAARDALSASPLTSPLVDLAYIRTKISEKIGSLPQSTVTLGAPFVVEVKTTLGWVPDLARPPDPATGWKRKWEAWKNYFAVSFVYAHEWGASRFEIYNEPDHPASPMDPLEDYAIRARLAGDAIQRSVTAANRALTPIVIGPTAAGGTRAYGAALIASLHTDALGVESPDYTLFQGYGYHTYGGDGTGSARAIQSVVDDLFVPAGNLSFPFFLTELNSECTACIKRIVDDNPALYPDGRRTYAADNGPFARRLIEKAIGFSKATSAGMNLYAFNFVSYAGTYLPGGLPPAQPDYTNNGLHYTSPRGIIGGNSKAAASYRFFASHFAGEKDRLTLGIGTDPAGEIAGKPPESLFDATYDAELGRYFVIAVNRAPVQKRIFFDLSDWDVSVGSVVTVAEVSSRHHGEITHRIELSDSLSFELTQDPDGVALVAVPRGASFEETLFPTADATVKAGADSASRFGGEPALQLVARSNAPTAVSAVLLGFDLSQSTSTGTVTEAFLELTRSDTVDPAARPNILHVYGFSGDGWTDDPLTGVRWSDVPSLKPFPEGAPLSRIDDNVVQFLRTGELDPDLRIAGTAAVAADPTLRVDVTSYVREALAVQRPRISLMIVREVRLHEESVALDVAFASREARCDGPVLVLRR